MWCHLFGLSSALWIFAWIVAVNSSTACLLPHISPLLLIILKAQKGSQIYIGPIDACFWIIPLLMLFLGPSITLANWLYKRNFHPFVDAQGKESFNFQVSVSICALLVHFFFNLYLFRIETEQDTSGIFARNLIWRALFIGHAFFPLLTAFQAILVIFAAFKAWKGQNYRYPFIMRLLK